MAGILIQKDPSNLIFKDVTATERAAWALDYVIYDVNADGSKSAAVGPTRTRVEDGAISMDTLGALKIGPDGRNFGLTSAQAAAVAIVDLSDLSGDTTATGATEFMSRMQAAMNRRGRMLLNTPGTYYWQAPADQSYVKGTTARQPSVLTFGRDTHIEIGEGVIIRPRPGTTYSAFLSNASFLLNKVQIASWSISSLIESEYKLVTFQTTGGALAIDADDFVILRGDTQYGWDGGYRVESVNVPNAATQFTLRVWKTEIDGLSVSANDTVIAYKADGNFSITIRGKIGGSVPGSITNANPGQGDRATIMLNKVVDSSVVLPDYNGGGYGKMVCAWNHCGLHFPEIRKRNVGMGIGLYGPGQNVKIGTLFSEGGEDTLAIQNVSNSSGVSNGAQDTDGTMASGDIVGVHVETMFLERAWQRGIGIFATGDLNDTTRALRIEGVRIDHLHVRCAAGASIMHICTDNITTAAGTAGGNVGQISIGNLYYEDNGSAATPPDALFKHYTSTTPNAGLRWEGLSIDNLVIRPSRVGPSLGMRAFLASLGGSAAAATPLTVGPIVIKNINATLDSQHMAGAPRFINLNNYTTFEEFQILGGKIRGLLTFKTPAVSAGGSGYVVGDIVRPAGGTVHLRGARLRVTSVASGVVTGLALVDSGGYSTMPASPASTTGGTGSGLTVTWDTTSYSWSLFLQGSTSSLLRRANFADLTAEFSLNGSNRNVVLFRGTSGGTTVVKMARCHLDCYSVFNAGNTIDLQMTDCDLQNTTYNLSQGSNASGVTHNVWLSGNRFSNSQSLITPNAASVTGAAAVLNVYSAGNNQNTNGGGNNGIVKKVGGNTSLTVNLLGNCIDIKQDLAPTSDYVVARQDGTIVYNTNAALGTLGAAGLVVGQGTAANSWRLMGDPTLRY